MFKHILIPTDGSRLAAKGVKAGVELAKALGASEKHAAKALSLIGNAARAAGVRSSIQSVIERHPWQGILKVARSRKCDAIAMASHGRSGLGGLLLGSETARVLAHSKIPVVVTR